MYIWVYLLKTLTTGLLVNTFIKDNIELKQIISWWQKNCNVAFGGGYKKPANSRSGG